MAVTITKRVTKILVILLFTVLFSCEEQGLFINCKDCYEEEPVTAQLSIKVEKGISAPSIIKIYEGNLDDSILVYSVQNVSDNFSHEVTLNRKYTLTATYDYNGDRYIAVDSATPKVKYTKDQCDNPCYWVYDRIIDLTLKSIR